MVSTREPQAPARGGPWAALVLAVVVASILFEAVLVLKPWSGTALSVFDDLCLAAAGFVAAVACLARVRRESGQVRTGWRLLGAGTASFGVSQLIFAYQALTGTQDPAGSAPGDVLIVIAVALAIPGLLCLAGRSSLSSRLLTVLDSLIIALSCLFVGWSVVLGSVYRSPSGEVLPRVTTMFYIAASLALTAIVLVLAMRWQGDLVTLGLLGVAFGWISVANAGYGLLTTKDEYETGNVYLDIGWFTPFLLIALAALRPSSGPAPNLATLRRQWLLTLVIPYSATLLVVVTTLGRLLRGGTLDLFLQFTGLVVIFLVLARQLLTLVDNRALTLTLERRVAARSADARHSSERLRSLLRNSADIIAVADDEGRVVYASPAIKAILGYDEPQALGYLFLDVVHPDERAVVARELAAVGTEGFRGRPLAVRMRHADAEWRPVELILSPLHDDPNLRGVILNIRDVSERTALEDELRHQASYDPLTGLANRRLFHDRVQHALGRARRTAEEIAVLFIDLDHFKRVNDSAGHAVGDHVLVRVSERLLACLRPSDTAARLGGDEFAVLLEGLSGDHTAVVARRIVQTLSEPHHVEGGVVVTTASVGIASCAGGKGTSDSLLRNADISMYEAKALGRGRYATFHPLMHARLIEQMELETGLREAIEQQSLRLNYQPIVDLVSGEISGVESLVRWWRAPDGEVPPALFIPLAEERGLILELDRWVLGEACRQVREWQQRYPRHAALNANVNLSALELAEPDLCASIADILATAGLAPEHLVIEITETAVLPDPSLVIEQLCALRDLGVGISLDDFGTGNASLASLQSFPIDEIKIDQSFVEAMENGPTGRSLVSAIVDLAGALNLRTVAEAVETTDQMSWLKTMRCGSGQGYLFAPPLEGEDLAQVLEHGLAAYSGS